MFGKLHNVNNKVRGKKHCSLNFVAQVKCMMTVVVNSRHQFIIIQMFTENMPLLRICVVKPLKLIMFPLSHLVEMAGVIRSTTELTANTMEEIAVHPLFLPKR